MIVLGLGSNRGDRLGFLKAAKGALAAFVSHMRCSPVYASAALLPEGAPPDWDVEYYNMAIAGETMLTAQELLSAVKAVEQKLGRQERGRWGPREIDIDILAYGMETVNEPDLIIPHTGLLLRGFALVPLADVAPDWVHPQQGKKADTLAAPLRASLRRVEECID